MGHIMYLARDDNRTLYDLGKDRNGLWLPLSEFADRRTGTFVLSDTETLAEFILDGILDHGHWEQPADYRPFSGLLARRMVRWGGGQPVRVIGEHEAARLEIRDEDRYLVTDSRYQGEWPYYDTFVTLPRELQEQIDYNRGSSPCDLPEVRYVRSFNLRRFSRPNTVFVPTEEGMVRLPDWVEQNKFLEAMLKLKPLTTNRGCGMFGCSISGCHDHGIRDTNTNPELRFCGIDRQMHKLRPEWKAAMEAVKSILSTRENV